MKNNLENKIYEYPRIVNIDDYRKRNPSKEVIEKFKRNLKEYNYDMDHPILNNLNTAGMIVGGSILGAAIGSGLLYFTIYK